MKKLIVAFLIALATAFPVSAHTALVSATPAADSTLSGFPSEITLTFNENLLEVGDKNPNKVEVLDQTGYLLTGTPTVSGATITAPLGITGNGEFQVKYRVVSQDGHVVEGNYNFKVDSPIAIASPMPISAPAEESAEPGSNLLVRVFILLCIGGAAFIVLRKVGS